MVKIKVPGTSANIGPGFDTLGLALNIFNEITVEKKNSGIEVLWDIPNPNIPLEDNLVYVALVHTLKKYKKEDLGCTVRMTKVDIPISRGLGSSAAAIVCGIYAAHYLMDYSLSTKDIVNIATELEGHPDNVAPAIFGGMTVSLNYKDEIKTISFMPKLNLKMIVAVPEFCCLCDIALFTSRNHCFKDCFFIFIFFRYSKFPLPNMLDILINPAVNFHQTLAGYPVTA